MKKLLAGTIALTGFILLSCTASRIKQSNEQTPYKPDSQELYNTVVKLDSIFFKAYNTCDIELQSEFYSDSIEFYHDQGGLNTSKKDILEATKKNICGKVTRELVKGSIEVYPIHGFGAVEMGLHRFHNNTQQETGPSKASKFVIIWRNKNNTWKITRVVSLH